METTDKRQLALAQLATRMNCTPRLLNEAVRLGILSVNDPAAGVDPQIVETVEAYQRLQRASHRAARRKHGPWGEFIATMDRVSTRPVDESQ